MCPEREFPEVGWLTCWCAELTRSWCGRSRSGPAHTVAAQRPNIGKSWLPRSPVPAGQVLGRFLRPCRKLVPTRTSNARDRADGRLVYLIDTNVISEARKGAKANQGVVYFFKQVIAANEPVYLAAVSVGELRRGVEIIRHRGDI